MTYPLMSRNFFIISGYYHYWPSLFSLPSGEDYSHTSTTTKTLPTSDALEGDYESLSDETGKHIFITGKTIFIKGERIFLLANIYLLRESMTLLYYGQSIFITNKNI